uniref:Phytocyanin domain-containing protein n=1 Tax=Opuntia streptacantha TaxID=393608 RepID=A0A7C9A4U3_OPUST
MEGFFFLFFLFFLVLHRSNCAALVVDGVTQLSNPIADVGDTIIFKHKYHYYLYIFRSRDAFNACNFTQATPLSNPNSSTYSWHASRPGYFYFSFYNGSRKPCQEGQKLALQIIPPSPPPHPSENSSTPPEASRPATSGGVVSSSPAFPWPFQPREKAGSGAPTPDPITADGGISPAPAILPVMPEKRGSIPFISSNPAVPLPTGEVDSATIKEWPFSVNRAPHREVKVVGLIVGFISLCIVIMVIP